MGSKGRQGLTIGVLTFTVVSVLYVTFKGIQDSLEFRIPGTGFQFLSDPGFWTPIVYLVGFRIP